MKNLKRKEVKPGMEKKSFSYTELPNGVKVTMEHDPFFDGPLKE